MPSRTDSEANTTGPLAGIVVVEPGNSVAAPFAGQILADLGAEVIKIEKADGDDARRWGPPFWEGAAPRAPVQNIAQMLAHEQTHALGLLQNVPDSAMKLIGLPLSFDGVRPAIRSRPPRLGEHTDEFIEKGEG